MTPMKRGLLLVLAKGGAVDGEVGPKDDPDEKGIVTGLPTPASPAPAPSPKDDPDEKGIVTLHTAAVHPAFNRSQR